MKLIMMIVCLFSVKAFAFEAGPAGVFSNYTSTSFTQTPTGTNIAVTPGSGTGFGGGLMTSFMLSPRFDFELGALYVNEGVNASFSGTATGIPVTGTVTSNLPFIDIPVLLNLNLGQVVGLHAGGYYGIATGTSKTTTTTTALGTTTPSTSSSPNTVNDYGAVGGIEFKFNLSASTKLLLSGDYYYGFSNLNSGTANVSTTSSRIIHATVGVLFHM